MLTHKIILAFFVIFFPVLSFADDPKIFIWNVETDYFDMINFASPMREPEFFNREEKTLVLIHGFSESMHKEVYRTFARRVKKVEPKTNVLALDWLDNQNISWIPGTDPVTAATQIPAVAYWTYSKLFSCRDGLGLSAPNLHIVGFSHGAHIAALIGKHAGGNIAHITLLDPSTSKSHIFSWENFLGDGWTTKESAKFIDMYKTSNIASTHSCRGNQSFHVQKKGFVLNELSVQAITENHYYALYWYISTIGKKYDKFGYSLKITDTLSVQPPAWAGTIESTLPLTPSLKDYDNATDCLSTE